jgi:hypothetical protein
VLAHFNRQIGPGALLGNCLVIVTQTVGKDHGTRGTIGTHGSVTGHKQHGPLRHMCTNSTALPLFVWGGGAFTNTKARGEQNVNLSLGCAGPMLAI